MHILLTDLLTCPRCGPDFGLILRGDRIEERRVLEGLLGCPNCREGYPIEDGFTDLRAPPRRPLPPVIDRPEVLDDPEEVLKIAALFGVKEGPGNLVVVGPVARVAPALADLLERIEIVTVAPDLQVWEEAPGVSRMAAGPGLPFYPRRIRGVLLDGEAGDPYLEDAPRVVGPGGRVVVLRPARDRSRIRTLFRDEGLEPILDEPGVFAASR